MPNSRLLSMPDVPLSNPNADVSQLPYFGTAVPGLSWMDRLRFMRGWLLGGNTQGGLLGQGQQQPIVAPSMPVGQAHTPQAMSVPDMMALYRRNVTGLLGR